MKILIVDQDPALRRILRALLHRSGHEVIEATNGQSAWEILQLTSISIVITDWSLPVMDGPELIHKIRDAIGSDVFPYYIYIIILTFKVGMPDVIAGLQAGADDYLTKPFDPRELRERITVGERILSLEHSLHEARNKMLQQLAFMDRPTLFVEGRTDATILKCAISLFKPSLLRTLHIASEQGAGHKWVQDSLMAWIMIRNTSPAAGLFDGDEDARRSKRGADDFRSQRQNHRVTTLRLDKDLPKHLQVIFQKGIRMSVSLEEMFPPPVWQYAAQNNCLERRSDIMQLNGFADFDRTFKGYCVERGLGEVDLLYVLNKVKLERKENLAKHVTELSGNLLEQAITPFKPLVVRLATHFLGMNEAQE